MELLLPPAAAESLFHVGSIPITNSMVNGWIAVVFFVFIAFIARRRSGLVPKGIHNLIEAIVEFLLKEIQKVTGDEKRAKQFLPIVGTIFLFILFSNWIGLFPGTGSIGIWEMHEGEVELIPLLRPAASDLNLTLAIALFAVLASHIMAMFAIGPISHISKFINIRGIFRSFKKGPMAVVVAIVEFGVGLIEIVSEVAKVVSLSLRLFGNIFAGEVLLTVMLGLLAYFLPIPFMFLELLVGAIQATVFAMLTLAYLTVATQDHSHDESEAHSPHQEEITPATTQ
ncbi:MAG: ATP synthase subunit a [Candidatus Uhrbacteria bacterium GW2011_GWF2_39_13]|uniref:ATP synthase subunit a n=1 Tax=Candidatus Uhrbacteria bacterium GW2011_GWF2_39_13 TaxID=1618995 RepID=A0A0G0Q2J4_9BACT|nr:MAG: ATP synthase subunit a [Candidatus Uhrbacteria bacterium GW2011_GWF2_39_13]HAU66446.1 ATP synthase F0 subunit A [Candidatus Uhrbacteria bacterium]